VRRHASRRGAVRVEANLFARIVRVAKSYANQLGECSRSTLPARASLGGHSLGLQWICVSRAWRKDDDKPFN
jgi:hypothetical protein